MRKAVLSCFLVASLAFSTASWGAVIWTGTGANPNDLFGDDNYDFSGSSVIAINESVTTGLPEVLVDAPVLDNVTFTNATINAAFATGFGQFRLGNGFQATLDNSSITSTTNGGIAGQIAPGTATFNVLNGSNLNMQFVTAAVVNVDSTSTLRFRGGGDPINSVDQPAFVNLAPGARLTLPSVAEFTEQGNSIFVNGVPFSDGSTILNPGILSFNGTTGTAIAPVPEPSSAALLVGLSLAAACVARSKRNA
ncbi:PEP-CTERM sorting domain-containing protein [Pirellulimonas nuda]|uniref:PEP-CTERM sorting domain-containing protein n=1 Tax=Pirellulimonas nuda TaxID=2528009 RepID=UPI0011A68F32|nr:PEP-CTERM sorting domain-containing protein [Pirellulimonas nuda]